MIGKFFKLHVARETAVLDINLGRRSVLQAHPVVQHSVTAWRRTAGSSSSPSLSSSSLSTAAGSGVDRLANVLRARLSPLASPAESPTITALDITNAWEKIVQANIKNSKASKSQSMQQSGTLPRDSVRYRNNVNAWLENSTTAAQLVRQKQEIRDRAIGKSQMLPGDIVLRKEAPPQSLAHAVTLPFQLRANLNGIEPNNGDNNIFHVAQWIGNKNDASMQEKTEIVEASGGLGTTNAMRVLVQSIQVGQYWVYRAKPHYGLPPAARDILIKRRHEEADRLGIKLVPPLIGEASSVVAQICADNKEPYSKSMMSAATRADGEFVEPTPNSRKDAFKLAAAPNSMSHVGETSENAHYRVVKARENAERGEHRGTEREGGDVCSTFIVRIAQTAALQIAAANYLEEVHDKKTNLASDANDLKVRVRDALCFDADGQMNDNIKKILNEAFDSFTGLIAKNPEGIAPKTIEHFCRDKQNFEFIGVLSIAADDVLEKERCFDMKGDPIFDASALPSDSATCSQIEAVAQTVSSTANLAATATAETPVMRPPSAN